MRCDHTRIRTFLDTVRSPKAAWSKNDLLKLANRSKLFGLVLEGVGAGVAE